MKREKQVSILNKPEMDFKRIADNLSNDKNKRRETGFASKTG